MKYRRFDELPVWKDAIELGARTFAFLDSGEVKVPAGLRDQTGRAVISISNNIAEGFERGTHEELLSFLYIARGSVGEVRSMLFLLARIASDRSHSSQLAGLQPLTESVSRQLGAWIVSLKNSQNRGPRHQTDATRQRGETVERQERFLEKLRRIQEKGNRHADD